MDDLIRNLKSQELVAECPCCHQEFHLSDALLFDGTGKFPDEAKARCDKYEIELKSKRANLRQRKKLASERAAITTESVSVGKMVEHLVPILEGFDYNPADCRTLFDPIDLLIFDGLSSSNVDLLAFMEIKTGNARFNTHQRKIRDAIKERRVFYEEV
jgi:predicted Holliday junction resolvase-like endonuclease